MKNQQLIDFLSDLTPAKRKFLRKYLEKHNDSMCADNGSDTESPDLYVVCPHCDSETVIRYGKFKSRKRYRCQSCGKTFTESSGWELAHTRKGDEFINYLKLIIKAVSIRQSAKELGVTERTVFLWRKRILETFTEAGKKTESQRSVKS